MFRFKNAHTSKHTPTNRALYIENKKMQPQKLNSFFVVNKQFFIISFRSWKNYNKKNQF